MKNYNRSEPLFYFRIPESGGTSIETILMKWFGKKYFRHEFNKNSFNFRKVPSNMMPSICVGGDFSVLGSKGVNELYPDCRQFITFLREPFEIALSQYFFWKKKWRRSLIRSKLLKPGSESDYKNLSDFLNKKPRSILQNFLPVQINMNNFKKVIHDNFIYIGIAEDLQTSIDILAEKLAFNKIKVEELNGLDMDEFIPDSARFEFIKKNMLEYEVYSYILSRYKSDPYIKQ